MNAVGKLGSYISKSVNTVSAPFHPFGGAVDIIVVEQDDGSYKSSPWYVRFGKFQGVLKAKEKMVRINVNGVDADFHMYLDHKGEAYFIKEEDVEDAESLFSPSSSGEDTDGQSQSRRPVKSRSWNCDGIFPDSVEQIEVSNGNGVARTNVKRSRILGFMFGRKSMKGKKSMQGDNCTSIVRAESLEHAEIAADLLEVKWSTNFASSPRKDNASQPSAQDDAEALKKNHGQRNEDSGMNQNIEYSSDYFRTHEDSSSAGSGKNPSSPAFSSETSQSQIIAPDDSCNKTNMHGGVCVRSEILHVTADSVPEEMSLPENESSRGSPNVQEFLVEMGHTFVEGKKGLESEITSPNSITDNSVTQSSSQVVSIQPSNGFKETVESCDVSTISSACISVNEDQKGNSVGIEVSDTQKPSCESALLNILGSEISEEEQLLFGELDDFVLHEGKNLEEADLWLSPNDNEGTTECSPKYEASSSPDNSSVEDIKGYPNDRTRKLETTSSDFRIPNDNKFQHKETACMVRSLPNMWSLDNGIASDLGNSLDHYLDSTDERSKRLRPPGLKSCGRQGHVGRLPLAEQATQDSKIIDELEDRNINLPGDDPSKSVNDSKEGWKFWPFPSKGSGSTEVSNAAPNCNGSSDAENISKSPSSKGERIDLPKIKNGKRKIIMLTPTSEQLATLNLKEGRNTVVFTFSTPMLGKQQVDARIYLWHWDTRIVISDVDGTITRSDVLGQFMPLVGVDWTQTGVTHLFSAIKENGYQLMFLSARAISQAHITRQFLCNLKQDGKTLPDGPVVISPDGLFPSLFREVVRRAPHEFKIACLEEIKALFPSDMNPFYAGFGNRDTDELSYVKVGIPKGKIFTINPKGEVVVNRHIDTKSYTSLHALVNRMFPPMPESEQEDFNSWNFWKLPPAAIM